MSKKANIEESNKKWLAKDPIKKPKVGLKEKIEMGSTYRTPVSKRFNACRG